MPVSYGDLFVVIIPVYVQMVYMERRFSNHKSDAATEEDLQRQKEKLEAYVDGRVETLGEAVDEDVDAIAAMMNELHDEARVIHDNVIDHNPCVVERETGDCPFCESPEASDK